MLYGTRARSVSVEVRCSHRELQLVIRDDGVGFDVSAARERAAHGTSLGLLGMQERVELVGGQIEIESAPMRGTEMRVCFPLVSPQSSDAQGERRAS
jgi:signal transduction histidine kinase